MKKEKTHKHTFFYLMDGKYVKHIDEPYHGHDEVIYGVIAVCSCGEIKWMQD